MPFFRCTICHEDGSPVAKGVMIVLEETTRDKWYGTITAEHLTDLQSGQRYVLHLDDGRKGEFSVRRNTSAGNMERAVAIQGTGPLA